MAYTINRFDTSQLTVVEDGTIDQTTDLKLVGKNYAGYGEIQNENFVFLLENFAGNNQPPKPVSGQLWFDSSSSKLKFYDGTKWRTTGGAEISATSPAGLAEGDFWWDTNNEQLYAYNGTSFILVGPQGAGDAVTQFQSRTIRDNGGTNRAVIVSIINDEVIHIISSIEFTIGSEDATNYPGFDVVRQGLTLKNTINSTGGVTSTPHRFFGTASNADKLGGVSASNYIQTGLANFNTLVEFSDFGLAVGDSNDLVIKIVDDDKGLIANEQGQQIFVQVQDSTASQKMPLRVESGALLPGYSNLSAYTGTNVTNIGSTTHGFGTVYATTFSGSATSSQTLDVGGTGRAASTSSTANTIAARNSSGDLYAQVFHGIATQAQYADLAEKYKADKDYEPGTVLIFGGEEEVTECKAFCDIRLAGVVSTEPAHLMNDSIDGVAIALKGRVPCKVEGPVKKGDIIVTGPTPGVATGLTKDSSMPNSLCVVGKSLEDSDDSGIRLIEVAV
tara:strand:- start:4244 stop:5752 length:1509 start_codon:yes stop_codon:yes gene_type:complete